MENASKALLMAGGVMLTILIISLLLYAWTSVSEYQAEQQRLIEIQELSKFNQQFTNYQRDDVQGYELLSLVNKVVDYNQRFSKEGAITNSSAGNVAQYSPITILIKLDSSSGDYTNRDKFTGSITVPAVPRAGKENEIYDNILSDSNLRRYDIITYNKDYSGYDRLFEKNEYKQSNTTNTFKNDILNVIYTYKDDAGNTHKGLNDKFGGDTNAQNLTKSRGTIFESKVINYNGQPSDNYKKNWYEESYIESRYKTLTGKNLTIEDIRKKDNILDVLRYYEFMEFKKAVFECTELKYNDETGRVEKMTFEIV